MLKRHHACRKELSLDTERIGMKFRTKSSRNVTERKTQFKNICNGAGELIYTSRG